MGQQQSHKSSYFLICKGKTSTLQRSKTAYINACNQYNKHLKSMLVDKNRTTYKQNRSLSGKVLRTSPFIKSQINVCNQRGTISALNFHSHPKQVFKEACTCGNNEYHFIKKKKFNSAKEQL
jgi:hypothetical protein